MGEKCLKLTKSAGDIQNCSFLGCFAPATNKTILALYSQCLDRGAGLWLPFPGKGCWLWLPTQPRPLQGCWPVTASAAPLDTPYVNSVFKIVLRYPCLCELWGWTRQDLIVCLVCKCVCVCVFVCMRVCVRVCVCVHLHACTQMLGSAAENKDCSADCLFMARAAEYPFLFSICT